MTKKSSRYNIAKKVLIFWTLFVGVGAVGGAVCMLADRSGRVVGMDALLPYFQVLPFSEVLFRDFLFSGIALLVVNGITNIVAAALLLAKKKAGIICGGIFGVTLMLWIIIQFVILPPNFMSIAYFVFGFCQALTGYIAYVFFKQENFVFDAADYKNIGKDPRQLVVYFSRMGYGKKLAYERADATGAELYEIVSTEGTEGTLGFWWCGRFGMHRWDMPIAEPKIDFSAYEEVTICSPIWVFSLAAPVRAFCKTAAGKIKKVNYIFVHYTAGKYENAAKEADELLGLSHAELHSYTCRTGKYKLN